MAADERKKRVSFALLRAYTPPPPSPVGTPVRSPGGLPRSAPPLDLNAAPPGAEVAIVATALFSAISVLPGPVTLAQLPAMALLRLAAFLAPCIAPLATVARAPWALVRNDEAFWAIAARRLQASDNGRRRLLSVSASLVHSWPSFQYFIPLVIAEHVSSFSLMADGARVACSFKSSRFPWMRDGEPVRSSVGVYAVDACALVDVLDDAQSRWFSAVAASPRGDVVACYAHVDARLVLFDARSLRPTGAWMELGGVLKALEFLVDGALVTATLSHVSVWDVASGELRARVATPFSVTALAVSPAEPSFACCTARSFVSVWRCAGNKFHAQLAGHANVALDVTYALDGRLLLSSSSDCTARVWNADSGECVFVYVVESAVEAVAAAGSFVALAIVGEILVYALLRNERLYSVDVEALPFHLRFASNETLLIKTKGGVLLKLCV